jgi:hypothetical protein
MSTTKHEILAGAAIKKFLEPPLRRSMSGITFRSLEIMLAREWSQRPKNHTFPI